LGPGDEEVVTFTTAEETVTRRLPYWLILYGFLCIQGVPPLKISCDRGRVESTVEREFTNHLCLKFIVRAMKKIILLLCITIFGWIGWWLGAHVGVMTAYLASVVGSLCGVYVGVRINQDYLDL